MPCDKVDTEWSRSYASHCSRSCLYSEQSSVAHGQIPSVLRHGKLLQEQSVHNCRAEWRAAASETFAKVLQQEGYSTGYIGENFSVMMANSDVAKQSVEDPCHHPLHHGFDYFYGLPLTNLKDFGDEDGSVVTTYFPNIFRFCYTAMTLSAAFSFLLFRSGRPIAAAFVFVLSFVDPAVLVFVIKSIPTLNGMVMRNFDVVEQPARLPGMMQRLIAESQRFVRSAVAEGKLFLLFLSFIHVHTALFSHPFFVDKSAHSRYGDKVEELDWAIGKVGGTFCCRWQCFGEMKTFRCL
ncbi:hypothetical protein MRX96_031614 [Rhipicephalus microplus]